MTYDYVIVFLVGFCLLLLALLFAMRQVEKEKKLVVPKPHVHRWRQITEFSRQCDDRACAVVEVQDGAPDGMSQYLALMTTPRAREHPVEEAEIYSSLDSRMNTIEGTVCIECERIYPKYFPWCPFCDSRAIPHMIYDEQQKVFTIATEETILRLEQERRERAKSRHVQRITESASDSESQRADSRN